MIDSHTLIAFVLVTLGLFLIPGPAVLLVLARGMSGGRRVGIATGLGIASGDFLHTLMATLGLSAVLMTSALAFNLVKYLGAAYLIYLGIRAFLEKSSSIELPAASRVGPARAYRQAVLAEVLNPKTALFFLAFLPQFVHPERGATVAQFAELGAVFVLMSALYTALIATGAGAVGRWLTRHKRIGRWQGKFVGTIYLSLGIKLALEQR
ncbi:MAG TPA: LysE family translocator [Steroidobacteraceae bacterium]|jgi:threonine/homoserine/homoserine lactone efflux protein